MVFLQLSAFVPFSRLGPCFPIWLPSSIILPLSHALPQHAHVHCNSRAVQNLGFVALMVWRAVHLQNDGFGPSFECTGVLLARSNKLASGVTVSAKKAGVWQIWRLNNSEWGEGTPLRESGSYVAHVSWEHQFQAYIFTLSLFVL